MGNIGIASFIFWPYFNETMANLRSKFTIEKTRNVFYKMALFILFKLIQINIKKESQTGTKEE